MTKDDAIIILTKGNSRLKEVISVLLTANDNSLNRKAQNIISHIIEWNLVEIDSIQKIVSGNSYTRIVDIDGFNQEAVNKHAHESFDHLVKVWLDTTNLLIELINKLEGDIVEEVMDLIQEGSNHEGEHATELIKESTRFIESQSFR